MDELGVRVEIYEIELLCKVVQVSFPNTSTDVIS